MYRCYKNFCRKSIRLLLLFETIAAAIVSVVFTFVFGGFVGTVIGLAIHIVLLALIDYVVFGGIALKKQKIMDWVRSSNKGPEIVRKALFGDALMALLRIMFPIIVDIIFMAVIGEISVRMIVGLICAAGTALFTLCLTLTVTRRFCVTLQMHMLFSYLFACVSAFFFIPTCVIVLSENIPLFVVIIFTVFMTAVAFGMTVLMTHVCKKGFLSGYSDT